jgi:hypothetical protein
MALPRCSAFSPRGSETAHDPSRTFEVHTDGSGRSTGSFNNVSISWRAVAPGAACWGEGGVRSHATGIGPASGAPAKSVYIRQAEKHACLGE